MENTKNTTINLELYSRDYAGVISKEVDNLREQGKMKLLQFHNRIWQTVKRNVIEKEFAITEEELKELKEFFKIQNIEIKEGLIKGEIQNENN